MTNRTISQGHPYSDSCVMISPSTGSSVSVTTSSARPRYTAPHPNYIQNRMVPLTSGIVYALQNVHTEIRVSNIPKEPTTLPQGMATSVDSDLPEVVLHLYQAATISTEERGEIIMSQTPLQPYGTKQKNFQKIRWTDTNKLRPSMIISLKHSGKTTSILAPSTSKIIGKF